MPWRRFDVRQLDIAQGGKSQRDRDKGRPLYLKAVFKAAPAEWVCKPSDCCLTERCRAGAICQAEVPLSVTLNASVVLQDCGCLRDMRAIFAAAAADVASPLQQSRENYVTSSALRERTTSVLRIVPTWRLV
jgi:hypothetical protein